MSDVGAIDSTLAQLANLLGTGAPPTPAPPAPPTPPPPWPPWTGDASDRAGEASSKLDAERTRMHSAQVSAAGIINDASRITLAARGRMAQVRAGWESDKAALWPIVNTPKGRAAVLTAGHRRIGEASGVIRDTMTEMGGAAERLQAVGLDLPLTPGPALPETPQEDQRRQNQIEAFKQVFGREPTSPADWATAAALDPHTYNPDYAGVAPQISVVRIRPEPGQGVVRVSQWIAQRDVTSFPPWKRDFGNDRGPSMYFDPEDTKVTTYIDYENGLVVMRQNPSIELNSEGGPGTVKVGTPNGSVTQLPDGSVRVKYDAGNPFAPGFATDPKGILADHQVTVNGDLVFTPGPDGVQVNGTRTNYPSMEVYQDLPNGSTRTVLVDPAFSGSSLGPALNLPRHHDVGLGGSVFAPFDTGGWNPKYDVRAPLPATPFGPVTSPPSVPPLPTGGVVHF